ncbi:MAG: putative alpha,6-mannanase [Phycisphaerales bacterium]|nr:putative alpha,6-mannanase [Phycisphaerales bacterium]
MHLAATAGLSILLFAAVAAAAPTTAPALPSLLERGNLTMASIEKDFRGTGKRSAYYMDEKHLNEPTFKSHPTYAWGAGVQLSALVAGARLNPGRYRADMMSYVRAVDTHWFVYDGIGGFCAADHPNQPDRYYDDNAWLVLTFAEAYEITHDPSLLKRARDTMAFILSGEDDKLGGGIYWHEQKKSGKNTCINAPATVCALRLFKLTGDAKYLNVANRLYAWTKKNLQDPEDGLYWDAVKLDGGKIDKAKYTYNTALMIRAACLMYDQTGEKAYLVDADRMAKAAEAKWWKAGGAVADEGFFAHLLAEAMLDLGRRNGDSHWRELMLQTCDYLWTNCRDSNGHFPGKWNVTADKPFDRIKVMPQAAVARLFFSVAASQKLDD